jgi:hypothetical protein
MRDEGAVPTHGHQFGKKHPIKLLIAKLTIKRETNERVEIPG